MNNRRAEKRRLQAEREAARMEREVEAQVANLTAHNPAEVRYAAVAPFAGPFAAMQAQKIPVAVECFRKRGYNLQAEEQGIGTMRTLVFRK